MKQMTDDEIIKFLEIYKEYPSLWNSSIKQIENPDTSINNEIYKAFGDRLITLGIVEYSILDGILTALTKKQMQSLQEKIKYIEDAFHAEEVKVKNNLNDNKVYKSKLVWYENALFLSEDNSLQITCIDDNILKLNNKSASNSNGVTKDASTMSSKEGPFNMNDVKLSLSQNVENKETEEEEEEEEEIEDESYYYGKMVEEKLRTLPEEHRSKAQERINQVLSELESAVIEEGKRFDDLMKKYNCDTK